MAWTSSEFLKNMDKMRAQARQRLEEKTGKIYEEYEEESARLDAQFDLAKEDLTPEEKVERIQSILDKAQAQSKGYGAASLRKGLQMLAEAQEESQNQQ